MKLSARTRYATRLLLDLALCREEKDPRSAALLAEATGITVQFIEQILRPLKKAGLVASVRGAAGGHRLNADPADISLGRIVHIMEGGVSLTDCVTDERLCERAPDCRTRRAWVRASGVLERELDSVTLADLMEDPQAIPLPE